MSTRFTRRRFLRGALAGGAAITVGLPLLDVFLNDHGDALASGAPLPFRFGTWFWGLGMNADRWEPQKEGADFPLSPELEPLAAVRHQLSVMSGFSVFLAGEANYVHYSGLVGTLTGEAPGKDQSSRLPTLDVLVGDHIGTTTRFRSLEMAATGNPRHSYSQRNENARNPAEPSALSLYQRVFGTGFTDTRTTKWAPDPRIQLRQSALSIVREDRKRLEAGLGAADRARLDEYFTSLRQIENQLEIQLKEPAPLEACRVPDAPKQGPVSPEIGATVENHRLMSQVLALAVACDQTRVFNMVFSDATSSLRMPGARETHHMLTHSEPRDPQLGYQIQSTAFLMRSMEAWATFLGALEAIREGDGTVLDNCLILAHSDSSNPTIHSVSGLPVMLAGKAGGRVRAGIHVRGVGESTSRVGLTVLQAMGLRVDRFGSRQNESTRPISAVLV
jgi:hypothetical protein